MLDSANDSVRRLKAALAAAEAATATARGEAGAAARAAEEADAQLAEREAEIADLQCAPSLNAEAVTYAASGWFPSCVKFHISQRVCSSTTYNHQQEQHGTHLISGVKAHVLRSSSAKMRRAPRQGCNKAGAGHSCGICGQPRTAAKLRWATRRTAATALRPQLMTSSRSCECDISQF